LSHRLFSGKCLSILYQLELHKTLFVTDYIKRFAPYNSIRFEGKGDSAGKYRR